MATAKLGDCVQINYHRVPTPGIATAEKTCEFTVGGSEIVASISTGVIGMNPGERKQLTLPPTEAFGAVQAKLIRQIPRKHFPQKMALKVGKRLTAVNSTTGLRQRVTILEVTAESVRVDGNHLLAGQEVVVDVTMVSVASASAKKRSDNKRRVTKFDLGDSK